MNVTKEICVSCDACIVYTQKGIIWWESNQINASEVQSNTMRYEIDCLEMKQKVSSKIKL